LHSDDARVLAVLRQDARITLTRLSRMTHIPVSTLFNRLKEYEGSYIDKFTCVLDFGRLGYGLRAYILIRFNAKDREGMSDILKASPYVNSVFKVNNGFDYLVEGVFHGLKESEAFMDRLDTDFGAVKKQVHYVVDRVAEQNFLPGCTP
jgi:Lrp/AsnC family transcriptional regulator, regulator for asnA, asnC and gidA